MENDFGGSSYSYAMESSADESDLEFEGEREVEFKPKKKEIAKNAVIEIEGKLIEGTQAIFLVGEAGERLNVHVKDTGIKLNVNGEQVGSIHSGSSTTPTLIFLAITVPLALLHQLVTYILTSLKPTSSTIIASYNFPSYVTSSSSNNNPDRPPILYLRSHSTESLEKLDASSTIQPFQPPNLLHGLPASLLSLSTLSAIPSVLLLFPTASSNEPLNGPWSNNSSSTKNANSLYNIGPLSDEGGMMGLVNEELVAVAKELGWNWLGSRVEGSKSEKGFDWLERIRKVKRREQISSSMFM